MDGSISYRSFVSGCEYIVQKSKKFGEEWHLKASQFDEKIKYLVKKEVCIDIGQADARIGDDEKSDLDDFHNEYYIEDRDSACKEVSLDGSDHICFEYHIIYNVSYSVPVLYFQATRKDGQSLLLEEVWERVPRSHRDALEGKWSFITQTASRM